MKLARPILRSEIIGHRVSGVYELDLRVVEDFQERAIIVELESGLRFSIRSESAIVDSATGLALIFPWGGSDAGTSVSPRENKEALRSPITDVFSPYEWEHSLGLMLENRWVLHEGFSMTDNGTMLYQPDFKSIEHFIPLKMPESW